MATILLVDDEKIIRTLVRVALEKREFQVLEAGSGRRAITVARKHSGPIDLLLAELSLPRMSGVELAETLAPERPEMRAVFLSRVPQSAKLEAEARGAGCAVVREPFTMSAVIDLVATTLATGRRKPPARSAEDVSAPAAKTGNGR